MSALTPGGNVTLLAQCDAGNRATHKLDTEQSVLVGTSPNCGFRLEGPGLSAFHCLISLEQGTLWVQDWASQQGTLINGQPIVAKTSLTAGDQLRVGPYSISAVFEAGKGKPAAAVTAPSPAASPAPSPASATPAADDVVRFDASQPAARTGAGGERRECVDPYPASPSACPPPAVPWFDGESFEQETIALLRAEVEELQSVLAQRDAQIADLLDARTPVGGVYPSPDDCDPSDALLARMDDLLAEAACHDERVAVMEEILHAAEQAHQAEQEERRQLEAWVDDIERRIAQRDDQRNAETEALRERLHACQQERDRAQQQLQQLAAHGGAPGAAAQCYEETLQRLQHQNHQLQEDLAAVQAERRTLAERLENGESSEDQTLREERAAIAQERAQVSRLRSELTAKLAALEEMPERAEQPDREVAIRLRTLREHLREIHLQEQQQQSDSLSTRIARLWRRVDG